MNSRDVQGFLRAAENMADQLKGSSDVLVVGHIDADGVSAASIASTALERAGVPHRVKFIKKLDEKERTELNDEDCETLWLVDLGSGSYSQLDHPGLCVADHHVPDDKSAWRKGEGQNTLFDFCCRHVNPHLFGIDGSYEVSGAGTTYCVARAMDEGNRDLSGLAIVGAVGDFQDSAECRLRGFNRELLQEAEEQGTVKKIIDIQIFGRETRPLSRMLQYSSDPYLPRLTGNIDACKQFIQNLGISEQEEDSWRCWIDLGAEEKRTMASALSNLLLDTGRGSRAIRRLIGEVYLLVEEEEGTELHDAKEFATLLNSCGRYGKAEVGMAVCKGDRSGNLEEALKLQRNHRRRLADAIGTVMELGVERRQWIQHFHAEDEIMDSIVGIVAGMVLGSGEITKEVPVIAFANSDDGNIKVSARGTKELVKKGLDLASAMKRASEKVSGGGGGHNIAAGATIPAGKEEEFLTELEEIVSGQLS